ncbi:MAG: small basic protein [Candidatus Brocadiae bacterium]|nr:small basic protein [Candidatus Brocadiia bacterium]
MSIHKSLVTKSTLIRHRNVLTRAERVRELVDQGRLAEEDSVFGLAKVRVRRVKAGAKQKKAAKAGEEEAAAAAEATTGEAKPA